MRIKLKFLLLFVISLDTHSVEASQPPSAPTASQCLEISQTEPNEFTERFCRVKNACSYDVVIFYCVIRHAPISQDFLPGNCRAGNNLLIAPFIHPLRDLGLIILEA